MTDLDTQTRIRIAKAKLQLKQKQQDGNAMDTIADPFRQFNKGISLGLGFPVDIVNSAASLVGLDVEEPILGSAWIASQMNKAGVGTEPTEESFLGRTLESVGATVGPGGALGAIGRFGKTAAPSLRGSGPVAAAGREIVETFRRSPKAATAAELTAATAGGASAAAAQKFLPDSPEAEMAAELVGGFSPAALSKVAPPVARGAGKLAEKVPGVGITARAARSLRDQITPLVTKSGQKRLAREAIEEIAEDPKLVDETLRKRSRFPESTKMTVAQETGDRGLLTLERAAIKSSAEHERTYADMSDVSRKAMEQAAQDLAGPGQPTATREILDAQVNHLDDLLDLRITNAQQAARNKIDDMGGLNVVARAQANTITRGKLEEALADARIQETELWNDVPGDAGIPTTATHNGYERLLANRAETADPADIPDFVHEWLRPKKGAATGKTKLGDTTTVSDLRTLRSRILGEVRAERAKKGAANRTKIGFLQQLQGDMLDDLGALQDNSLILAREYSEQLNSKFFNKPIGRLLGHERAGGVEVAPELTLERTISQRGPEAGVNADALLKAAGDTPEVRQTIGAHIQQRFMQEATEQGAVVPRRAETFLNKNAQLLERFPEVRQQLDEALMTQGRVADVTATTKIDRAVLHDKNRNVAALYLSAKPSKEINAILEASPNKSDALKELWGKMQGDAAGEAGLKAAFVREMFGRAEMSKLDADGNPGIDPKKLRKDFNTAARAAQEAGWFTADEMGRLDEIVDVLQRLESNFAQGRSLEELVKLPFGAGIVDLGVRWLAATAGSRTPLSNLSSSLVVAGASVRAARRITAQMPTEKIRAMAAEAMFNRELFQDLFRGAGPPEEAAKISRRLNAWLINLGVDREEEQ